MSTEVKLSGTMSFIIITIFCFLQPGSAYRPASRAETKIPATTLFALPENHTVPSDSASPATTPAKKLSRNMTITRQDPSLNASLRDTLDRYWNLFQGPNGRPLFNAAQEVFAQDAIWESERLDNPISGRDHIIQHIQRIKTYTVDGIKTRSEPTFHCSPDLDLMTATWDWNVIRPSGDTISGTDYVEFSKSFLIQRISIRKLDT